jgi:lysylphosphatidylglycerol synthetase-like protein (DUF2156 family)
MLPRAFAAESAHTLGMRYGGCSSNVVRDPSCPLFSHAEIEGVIAYRSSLGCVVGIGDPICAPDEMAALERAFRAQRRNVIYSAASESFTALCLKEGYAAVEFAEDLVIDPRLDPQRGRDGRELRKKLRRADGCGVRVQEYRSQEPALERAMEAVAAEWLSARRGLQSYVTPVSLFDLRDGRRWFVARAWGRVVGVLSTVAMRGGWLVDHLLAAPAAPPGTSESLMTHCLAVLGDEGCTQLSFGASPLPELGRIEALGLTGVAIARAVYRTAARWMSLHARSRYRLKFQPVHRHGLFLLFHPARVGLREVVSLMVAFNVSWR